jgi:hypothetical protein
VIVDAHPGGKAGRVGVPAEQRVAAGQARAVLRVEAGGEARPFAVPAEIEREMRGQRDAAGQVDALAAALVAVLRIGAVGGVVIVPARIGERVAAIERERAAGVVEPGAAGELAGLLVFGVSPNTV